MNGLLIPVLLKFARFLFKDKSETLSSDNMSAIPGNDSANIRIFFYFREKSYLCKE